ncbi:MAG: hypothetical protein KF857_11585 [Fimbriimonadaceae bacterium]|nr:hypothetical protein [Fimbriimonadaceae bacterium]
MKAVLVTVLTLAVSTVWADDLLTARQMVAEAYGRLALQDVVHINLSGTTTTGDDESPFAVQMVVKRVVTNAKETVYLEGLVSAREKITHRYVADGEHLWVYDAAKNTYSVVKYGDAPTPALQGSRLFSTLKRVTTGPAQFASGFLADIDRCRTAGSAAVADTWTPYLSTAVVTTSGLGIACNARAPQQVTLTYGFQRDPDQLLWFSSATYEASKVVGNALQQTAWTMMEFATPPSTTDFTFNPGDATPVSITLAQGGG